MGGCATSGRDNKQYQNFLKYGNAMRRNPQALQVGQFIIPVYTTPDGKRETMRFSKINSVTGQIIDRNFSWYSGDIEITKIKKTAKQVKVECVSPNGSVLRRTFKPDDLIFIRKKAGQYKEK